MVIDRFEGEYAVVEENGKTFNIARVLLPKNVKSGDVLVKDENGFKIDYNALCEIKERIAEKEDRIFGKG